jgi:hypothetical protein
MDGSKQGNKRVLPKGMDILFTYVDFYFIFSISDRSGVHLTKTNGDNYFLKEVFIPTTRYFHLIVNTFDFMYWRFLSSPDHWEFLSFRGAASVRQKAFSNRR